MSNTFEFAERLGFNPSSAIIPNNQSNFRNSPFGENWEKKLHEWAKEFYGISRILSKSNITVADLSFKISNTTVNNNNEIIKLLSEPKYSYRIYANPDGSEVLKMYNDPNKKPEKDYEVLVFIETDDGKFDFGKIVRVKFGVKVVEDLRYNAFSELPWNDRDAEDIVEDLIKKAYDLRLHGETKNLSKEVNSSAFKDLMVEAIEFEYNDKKFDDLSWLAIILNDTSFIGDTLFDWSVDLSAWFRERKYKEEKYWNGDLPEDKYTPAFLPDFIFKQDQKKREDSLKAILNKPYSDLRELIDVKIQGNNPVYSKVREGLNEIIDSFQNITDPVIEYISSINIPEGKFKTYIKHAHAFNVGLWNGVMELLAGFVDLVGLFILVLQEEVGFRVTDFVFEKIEELANDLFYDTKAFFLKVIDETKKLFTDFYNWYTTYEGKSYYFVKNLAELIPELVTFVIPILKGSKAAKLGKLGKEVAEETKEQIAKNAKQAIDSDEAKKAVEKAKKKADEKLDEAGKEIDDRKILPLGINLSTKKMRSMFLKEETGLKSWCAPSIVKYLDDVERIKYKLTLKEGKLFDSKGKLFDTSSARSLHSSGGKAIFVMDSNGVIYASNFQSRGLFHHSSFLAGGPVSAAGELKVVKGVIKEITNNSGHYWPSKSLNKQVIKVLEFLKVETKNIILTNEF